MRNRAIEVPDWLSRSAVYQINPRTFTKEGTIKAVTEQLDFLRELGFQVLYLCPIFQEDGSADEAHWSERQKASGTNNPKNPYRISDYFKIDEEYGTMEDLKELVTEAHRRRMKVLLDLVYMHMGPNAEILRRHPEYAKQDKDGNMVYNAYHFAELDFQCPGLREYLWCNMAYYIDVVDVDGFRCDVGDMVPIDFWDEGKRRITRIKEDAVLLNEGCNLSYLLSSFESIYHFAWHEALYRLLQGESDVIRLKKAWQEYDGQKPDGGLVLRDLDNHDTVTDWPVRAELVAGHEGMEAALVMNYAIDGIPMVYCGNELADSSKLSMFANRFYPGAYETTDWGIQKEKFSKRRQMVLRRLNEWKASSDTLRYGKTVWKEAGENKQVVLFERVLAAGAGAESGRGEQKERRILYAGNFGAEPWTLGLDHLGDGEVLLENLARRDGDSLTLAPYGYCMVQSGKGA